MTQRSTLRLVLAACIALSVAASTVHVGAARAVGFEQITVDNTAGGVALTSSKYAPPGQPSATQGYCRLRTAEVSFTFDRGTTVTASVGVLLEPGEFVNFKTAEDLANFRAIRTTASSGQLDCSYFR